MQVAEPRQPWCPGWAYEVQGAPDRITTHCLLIHLPPTFVPVLGEAR
jgi:hypothetical protein